MVGLPPLVEILNYYRKVCYKDGLTGKYFGTIFNFFYKMRDQNYGTQDKEYRTELFKKGIFQL